MSIPENDELINKHENILNKHKEKWEALARENDRYYVRSVDHQQSDEEYGESGRKTVEDHILNDETLMTVLSPLSECNVLEIGCGSGRVTKTLATYFKNVAALDISRTMLEKARNFVDSPNVVYLESNGQDVPLFSESVDLAFSFIVYQHFPTKEAIEHSFKQVNRALRRGGLFKVQVRGIPNPNPNHWAWGPHFTKEEAEELAQSAGFQTLQTRGQNTQYFWMLLKKS
ncbi:class I SAM-dependent methyltransferase [Mesorhizobium sp. RMAD-H1]|uniref:class I SAM-dependent methyltransferase n=1 Tax=Mesorhizobium sp. RMAD-H1 TaxID=2587065 RepID=UPI001613126C|nr:class I SAM-dependent methyltransferase [Mesorhizobium sp. RMAD-H1]MBB2973934.1 SAM-dependent methyltransferase [Mesorhizobium sp. RMAD-H1]